MGGGREGKKGKTNWTKRDKNHGWAEGGAGGGRDYDGLRQTGREFLVAGGKGGMLIASIDFDGKKSGENMNPPPTDLYSLLCRKLELCLQELLETKVLYQNCSVDLSSVKSSLENEIDILAFPGSVSKFQQNPVRITIDCSNVRDIHRETFIYAPKTVCSSCEICKGEITPHNPIEVLSEHGLNISNNDQTYLLSYQCQKCKQGTLVFLVRRRGFKFQLVGRNQIPSASVPKTFPQSQMKLFCEAEMAYQTGSHLAAICLLRVALEQYLRGATESEGVCTGDQLWARFKEKLPSDFPYSRVTGLGEIYGRLSEIIHDPSRMNKDSYKSFEKDLDSFFRHLELFPPME